MEFGGDPTTDQLGGFEADLSGDEGVDHLGVGVGLLGDGDDPGDVGGGGGPVDRQPVFGGEDAVAVPPAGFEDSAHGEHHAAVGGVHHAGERSHSLVQLGTLGLGDFTGRPISLVSAIVMKLRHDLGMQSGRRGGPADCLVGPTGCPVGELGRGWFGADRIGGWAAG